jgi:hypothetical protein
MNLVKSLVPPVAVTGYNKVSALTPRRRELFEGDGKLFERIVRKAAVYGEYGVGKSTDWVYANTTARILAVDTSRDWIETVTAGKADKFRISAHWVDLGELGEWGRPKTYEKHEHFFEYVNSIWSHSEKPDVVLVDGRFRVCCFLHSLLESAPGTVIFFDDYRDRPQYHIVEEALRPTQTCGRQALFVTPDELDRAKVARLATSFLYVMD